MPSFNRFYEGLVDAQIDWEADTIKACLLTSSWTPSRTLDFYSELTNELATGDGYTTEGATLTGKSVITETNRVALDAGNPSWTFTASKSFQYVIFYKDTGTASTSSLIWYVDLNATTVSGAYELQFDAAGIIRFGDA